MNVFDTRDFGDFGRISFWTRARNVITNPLSRAGGVVKTMGTDLKHGNVLKVLGTFNPASLATQIVTSNEHAINISRLSMPASVANISDKSLKKKAAIGYAVAGAISTGIGAGPEIIPILKGIGDAIGTAGTAMGIAQKSGIKLPGQKGNQESEQVDVPQDEKQSYFAGMVTPQNIFLFMGLSALTVAGFMMFDKKSVKVK